MTIDEAILILTKESHSVSFPPHPEVIDAEELGIEALRQVKRDREPGFRGYRDWKRLPGETEE